MVEEFHDERAGREQRQRAPEDGADVRARGEHRDHGVHAHDRAREGAGCLTSRLPQSLQRSRLRVEAADLVASGREPGRHRAAHVAEPDEPDGRHADSAAGGGSLASGQAATKQLCHAATPGAYPNRTTALSA